MNWRVDAGRRIGPVRLAAVVEQSLSVRASATSIYGNGFKRPVVILLLRDGRLSGLDLAGRRLDEDEIERRYPSAPAQVRARAGAPEAAP